MSSRIKVIPTQRQKSSKYQGLLDVNLNRTTNPKIISIANQKGGVGKTTTTINLGAALANAGKRVLLLNDALHQSDIDVLDLDYILIDCPPSLNILTVNAMIASDSVVVPLQSEFFALEGLSQLMLTIREVRQTANKNLRIEGVVLTMYDKRNNLCQQVEIDARDNLGDLVFKTVIPRNVRLSEAPSFALSVIEYDPTSKGAAAYIALAAEIIDKEPSTSNRRHS